jgi:hypothetical protein
MLDLSSTSRGDAVKLFRKIKLVFILVTGISLAISPSVVAAPEYPPSIQEPVVGEPIQAPVAPRDEDARVVLPIVRSETIPTLDEAPRPRPVITVGLIADARLETRSYEVLSGVILGGLSDEEKSDAPRAIVGVSKDPIELQVASDVPVVISLRALPAGARATISFVGRKGRVVSLGSLTTTSKGRLSMPPITLDDEGDRFTLRITIGRTVYEIEVRATA